MPSGLKKTRLYKKVRKVGKAMARDKLLNRTLPKVYSEAARQSVQDDKVVFVEGKLTKMPDAYTLLWKRLEEQYDFDLRYITLKQNTVRYRVYEQNCENLVRELATAKYVFLNDASDVVSCLPLRPETTVVQLWHACGAFKKWGMSTADLKFGGNRKSLLRHPYYKNLDIVTVSSPEVEWAYREAMVLEGSPEVVQPLGVSRTDVFFDEAFREAAASLVAKFYPKTKGKKIILYAPTFRGRVKTAHGPDVLDIRALKDALGDECALLVKHHPFVKRPPEIPADCASFAFQVGNRLPTDMLMTVADICVSDYSSIVFEYSLFERPMAFLSPDVAEYDDWRGFYYDYDELTPGPIFSETRELIDWIEHIDDRFDLQRVKDFRQKFMSACDGQATQRIMERVFGNELDRFRTVDVVEELVDRVGEGPDISFIIPAYNVEETLPRAIDSILEQTYARNRIEVVVVDDCSSDGTREVVKRYAAEYPGMFVLESTLVQSGSPSQPRNIGLAAARGEYVFFLDADDWIGNQAVSRMLRHAVEWNSDVLAVKMCGWGGRSVPQSMFDRNDPDVDIYRSMIMWTFAPLKLFRRSLVADLRFPDFMPEDISFVLRAFVEADVVSIAADYNYYNAAYVKGKDANISLSTWDDVESNLRAYEDILGYIADRVPDDQRDHVLMRRLLRRDILRTLLTIAQSQDERRRGWFDRLMGLAGPFYRTDAYISAPFEKRILLDAAFLHGFDALCDVVGRHQDEPDAFYASFDYDVAPDRVTGSVALSTGQIDIDPTRGIRSRATLELASWEPGMTLLISGAIEASMLFWCLSERIEASVLVRSATTGEEHRFPCDLAFDHVEYGEYDEYPSKGSWSVALPAAECIGDVDIDEFDAKIEEDMPSGTEYTEPIAGIYVVLNIGGFEKNARLRFAPEYGHGWGSIWTIYEPRENHRIGLRVSGAGNFSIALRYKQP